MDWLSALIDWANENEGLLQALAMLGGIGALLISLRKQRTETAARTQAAEPVPAKVVIRPVAEDRAAAVTSVLGGYGGRVTSDGETLVAQFPDADDAARAALGVQQALSAEDQSATEILLCERSAPLPESAEGNRGAVHATGPIRKALLDAPDLAVNSSRDRGLPFVIEVAAPKSPLQVIRRWSLPAVGAGLVVLGATWLLFSSEPEQKPIRSLAVLPLENLSQDPEQEWFSDGMTEELIGEIAKNPSLKVISRTSAMRYKNTDKPLPQIGRELGIDAILEGSAQLAEGRVRINTRLIDLSTAEHLLAESYERPFADVLNLEREIAHQVAQSVRVAITAPMNSPERAVDPDAQTAVLKGRYQVAKRTPAALEDAISHFQEAIALDPTYSAGYSGLARAYFLSDVWVSGAPAVEQMKRAVEEAIRLDPHDAEAYATRAVMRTVYDYDWSGAEEDFRRSLDLNPNLYQTHYWYGDLLLALSRYSESQTHYEKAVSLDPIAPMPYLGLARLDLWDGEPERALEFVDEAFRLTSSYPPAFNVLLLTHHINGDGEAALEAARAYRRVAPDSAGFEPEVLEALALATMGDKAGALEALRVLKSRDPRSDFLFPYIVYVSLGELDRAFAEVERGFEEKSPNVIWLSGPTSEPVRDDPRYVAAMERLGLPIP